MLRLLVGTTRRTRGNPKSLSFIQKKLSEARESINTKPNVRQENGQSNWVGNYQSIGTIGNRQISKSKQRVSLTILTISGLLNIGYRIMLKRSDGTQEESTTLNTFPVGGGVTRQTHTNGKHLGYIYFDELTGADETYARTHPKH